MGYDAYIYRVKRKTTGPCIIDDSSDVNEVLKLLNNAWNTFDFQAINSWCSAGRYWVDFICHNLPKKICSNDEAVIRTPQEYAQLCKITGILLEQMGYQFGNVKYALSDIQDDGSFRCTPIEGVMIQLDDDTIRKVLNEYDDDTFLIPTTSAEQFNVAMSFAKAVFAAADTDWDNEFLLLGGSY